MHQDQPDHYIGTVSENIVINATAPDAGALSLSFNNSVVGSLPFTGQFGPAGNERDLVATLVGPPGSHCALSVENVDGGTDIVSILVGTGTTHDTVILEFLAGSAAVNAFIAKALKPSKKGLGK